MITKIDALLSEEDLSALHQTISELPFTAYEQDPQLGRIRVALQEAPLYLATKLTALVNSLQDQELEITGPPLYVEYNAKYGIPTLPPHFDGDFNDLIIDYQLESSPETLWPLGVNLDLYPLKDNEAVIFNPNTNIHWRPHSAFQPDQYIRMIFFRFHNPNNKSDYSHLPGHPNDPVFKEVATLRDNLPLLQ